MQDPFLPPVLFLTELVTPLCNRLHLYSLPLHIHEVLFAFLAYHVIFEYLAQPLSSLFLTKAYTGLSRESKLRWNMHCASMVQSCLITSIALVVMFTDKAREGMDLEQRMWGYTGAAAMVQAFATGYFVFDLVVMVRYLDVFGTGMLMHALSCVITYTLGFRPIFNYYGCVFMLYELSTPFLNIHWFFDKLGMTGTKPQLYNGIMLLVVFFLCRLVWGAYSSVRIYSDVFAVMGNGMANNSNLEALEWPLQKELMRFGTDRSLPTFVLVIYGVGHVVLQCLNVWWFGKMITAVRKRFTIKAKVEKKL